MDKNQFLWLVTHKFSNDLLPEEETELKELINKNSEWQEEYDALSKFWHASGELSLDIDVDEAYNQIVPHLLISEAASSQKGDVKRSSRIRIISIAASILLVISFTGITLFLKTSHKKKADNNLQWTYFSTNHSEKGELTLSDGTKVWLNVNSTLKYPTVFTGKYRQVFLIGEATFDVKHDPSHQFQVITRNMIIKDVGTIFDVQAYPNNRIEKATLIHGSIEVLVKNTEIQKTIDQPNETAIVNNIQDVDSLNNTHTKLKIAFTPRSSLITIVQKGQKDKIDSMLQDGLINQNRKQMVFNDESFSSLAQQLEIRYGVVIQITNEKVRNYRFTGIFTHENLEQALKALQLTEKFTYTIHGNFVIIH